MTLRFDRPNGVDLAPELESPFLAELPWARPAAERAVLSEVDLEAADPFAAEHAGASNVEGEWSNPEAEWESLASVERSSRGDESEGESWTESAFESELPSAFAESESQDGWFGFRHEGHVCHECGHAREGSAGDALFESELDTEWSSESESSPERLALLTQFAAEAEVGIGEIPLAEAFAFEEELGPSDVQAFAQRLGAEWSRRRNGKPTPEAMTAWLLEDHAATVKGANGELGSYFKKYQVKPEQVTRAWMISREESMKFQPGIPGVQALGPFEAPQGSPLTSNTLIENSVEHANSRVAALTLSFAQELRRRWSSYVRILNYKAHGGIGFAGRGYSLDLFIQGIDDRGFYPPDRAVEFLRVVHETATAVGAQWRVLYNDFRVAEVVNRALGRYHVLYVGNPNKGGGIVWHGPDPLILHFHLDLAPLSGSASVWGTTPAMPSISDTLVPAAAIPFKTPAALGSGSASGTGAVQPPRATSAVPSEKVRFAQRVLNAAERENLGVDGDLGPLTRAALDRFRKRYALGAGGVLDASTEVALVQRAFEELAQQSMFARIGVRDAQTDQALVRFRQERHLGLGALVDAPTRAALAQALEARAKSGASSPPKTASKSGGNADAAVVSRIDAHRAVIDRVGQELSVSPHLLRGIIAAESSGHANTGAGGTGYKGLMQCERTADQLTPEVSVRCGAKKYGVFAASMRTFFRDTLKRDFDALPEDERIRIVMAAYNAGPLSVKRAMQFALRAGDVNQWLSTEHYVRALLSTGAYNPVESVLGWGLKQGRLTPDLLASDLARLSGKPLAELRATYAPGGKWDSNRLAKALRPLLFTEKQKLTSDGSATLSALRSQTTASLLCAAEFKQAHTSGYLDTVVRYKRHFAGR